MTSWRMDNDINIQAARATDIEKLKKFFFLFIYYLLSR